MGWDEVNDFCIVKKKIKKRIMQQIFYCKFQ